MISDSIRNKSNKDTLMAHSAKKPGNEEFKKAFVPPPSATYKFSSNSNKREQPKIVPGSGKLKNPSSTVVM